MSQTEIKFTKDATVGQRIDAFCLDCDRETKHDVVASYDTKGSEWDKDEAWSVDWEGNYQVIQCRGCETLSFRHRNWFSEDWHPEYGDDGSTENLYPKRSKSTIAIKNFLNVPHTLRRIYREIVDTFNNDSVTLCAAGLRAIVEGVCADQAINDGPVESPAKGGGTQIIRRDDLAGRISGLSEKGLLTAASAQTLHEHRYMGNHAVHELDRPSADELRLAIEIVEHVLEQLYEMPEKVRELKKRRAIRRS
jgi:hypothetical protein